MNFSCSNYLEITGPIVDLIKMVEGCKSDNGELEIGNIFSLEGHMAVSENTSDSNVSIKEAHVYYFKYLADKVRIIFDTSEQPPENWFNCIASLYPTLTMSMLYNERELKYAGCIEAKNGFIDDNRYSEWNDYVDFVYGGSTIYGLNLYKICDHCSRKEVSIADIKKNHQLICGECNIHQQKVSAA